MTTSTDQVDRTGIHAVATIFTDLGWAFREQPTSDYGIDAQAEKLQPDGKAGGKLVALQIKSGASYFRTRGDGYVFYGEDRHRDYWVNHSLPVFIILHDPTTKLTLWQRVERHLIEEGKDRRWAIAVPASQTLDAVNEQFILAGIASDLPSIRRARLALSLPLVKQFSEQSIAFLRIQDWVNKSLNYRGAEIAFGDDPDGVADLEIDAWMPGYSIDYYMAVFFPWLDWTLYERVSEEEASGEVAVYVLEVELSEVGKAVLLLDRFYQSELPPFMPVPSSDLTWEDHDDPTADC